MGEKDELLTIFPGLRKDPDFEITSRRTPDYNCIAWASHYDNRWMWPKIAGTRWIDGWNYWPDGVENSEDVAAFITAFQQKGYQLCDSSDFEEGYRKIALYITPGTTNCTHAARQLSSGKWTSKLGRLNDIQHGTPFTIEGDSYGKVFCIMKAPYK